MTTGTASGEVCSDTRIALGAADPHARRARRAEEQLRGRPLDDETIRAAAEAAMEECEPFTDALASDWYRRKMVGVYVRRALEALRSASTTQ
jgi:carbon-monoxide dehydrogenase medium subunit